MALPNRFELTTTSEVAAERRSEFQSWPLIPRYNSSTIARGLSRLQYRIIHGPTARSLPKSAPAQWKLCVTLLPDARLRKIIIDRSPVAEFSNNAAFVSPGRRRPVLTRISIFLLGFSRTPLHVPLERVYFKIVYRAKNSLVSF